MAENTTSKRQRISVRKKEIELDREDEEGPYIGKIVNLGDGLIVGGVYDDCLKIWDSETGGVEYVIEDLYKDEKSVCCHSFGILVGLFNGCILLFDSTPPFRPKYPSNFQGHELGVTCLTSIDHIRFGSGSSDNKIRIWRIDNGDCLQILRNHRIGITSVLYLNDLKILCSCGGFTYERGVVEGSEYRVTLWDVDSGSVISKLPQVHTRAPTSLTYFEKRRSPNSSGKSKKILVSAGKDGRIVFYDMLSGEIMFSIQESSHYGISSLLLFDSNFIISGHDDGTIVFWDIWRQRKESAIYDEQLDCIKSMLWLGGEEERCRCFCGERVLVSASNDKSIYMYEVAHLSNRMNHMDKLEREEHLRKMGKEWMTVKFRLKKKKIVEWDRLRALWMNAIVLRLESAETEIRRLRKENQCLKTKVLEFEKNDR